VAVVSTDTHPYLFFSADELAAVRARAGEWPASPFRRALRADCESGFLEPEALIGPGRMPVYADRLQAVAMVKYAFEGMLSEERRFTDHAKKALINLTRWATLGDGYSMAQGGMLRDAAIAYDLLHGELAEQERSQAQAFLTLGARYLFEGGRAGDRHWSGRHQRLANWRAQMYSGIGIAGLALWGSHPEAREWVGAAADMMKDILEHDFDPEGAPYEAYVRYVLGVYYHSLFPMLEALRRVTGEDLFGCNGAVLQQGLPFLAYMMYPARNGMPSLGDSDDGMYSLGMFLAKVAAEYEDGLAAWYLDAVLKEGHFDAGDDGMWGTLWARPVRQEDPDQSSRLCLAKAYHRDLDAPMMFGSGHVFLRTGFSDLHDIQFMCQAGEAGGFHGHADKGSYLLNAYGVRFLRDYFSGPYEGDEFSYRHSGEAHQTMLIDGEGQGAEAVGLTDPDYHTQVARVELLESCSGYDYVRMDTTKAYQHNPANRSLRWARRHVVFIRQPGRSGYFVVIDDVQKGDQGHVYSHPFHYDERDVEVALAEGGHVVLANPRASLHIFATQHVPCLQAPDEVQADLGLAGDGLTATRHRRYGDPYVMLTGNRPCLRGLMVTVLYPVKGTGLPPAMGSIREPDQVGVEVAGVRVTFEPSTGRVAVSGALSRVSAVSVPARAQRLATNQVWKRRSLQERPTLRRPPGGASGFSPT
jgi:hypothetical protein